MNKDDAKRRADTKELASQFIETISDPRTKTPYLILRYPLYRHSLKETWIIKLCCMFPNGYHPLDIFDYQETTNSPLGCYVVDKYDKYLENVLKFSKKHASILKVVSPRIIHAVDYLEGTQYSKTIEPYIDKISEIPQLESDIKTAIYNSNDLFPGSKDEHYLEMGPQELVEIEFLIKKLGECRTLQPKEYRGRIIWLCKSHVRELDNLKKFEESETQEEVLVQYLTNVISHNNLIDITGSERERNLPQLEKVFIEFDVVEDIPDVDRRVTYAEIEERNQEVSKIVDEDKRKKEEHRLNTMGVPQVIANNHPDTRKITLGSEKRIPFFNESVKHQQLVLLGDPGSGKTTHLRYISISFAKKILEDPKGFLKYVRNNEFDEEWVLKDLGPVRLPILIRISSYSKNRGHGQTIPQYFPDYFKSLNFDDTDEIGALINYLLQIGACCVLLDGLDEVLRMDNRLEVANEINNFAILEENRKTAQNQFIVSSRIVGYRPGLLKSGKFKHYRICEMNKPQIKEFLEKWCNALEEVENPQKSKEENEKSSKILINKILEKVNNDSKILKLASNPVLLRILNMIVRFDPQKNVPTTRVEIYQEAIETFLEKWNRQRVFDRKVIPSSITKKILSELAFFIHENHPSGLLEKVETKRIIKNNWEGAGEREVDEFLEQVRADSGIFVERGNNLYGFMHLTFEEYFVGLKFSNLPNAKNNKKEDWEIVHDEIITYLHKPRWREPILLCLSYLSKNLENDCSLILKKIFQNRDIKFEKYLHRNLLFIADCLLDGVTMDKQFHRTIISDLLQIYCDKGDKGRFILLQNQIWKRLYDFYHGVIAVNKKAFTDVIEKELNENSDDSLRLRNIIELISIIKPVSEQVMQALEQQIESSPLAYKTWLELQDLSLKAKESKLSVNNKQVKFDLSKSSKILMGALWFYKEKKSFEAISSLENQKLNEICEKSLAFIAEEFIQVIKDFLEKEKDYKKPALENNEILSKLSFLIIKMYDFGISIENSNLPYFVYQLDIGIYSLEALNATKESDKDLINELNRLLKIACLLNNKKESKLTDNLFKFLEDCGEKISEVINNKALFFPIIDRLFGDINPAEFSHEEDLQKIVSNKHQEFLESVRRSSVISDNFGEYRDTKLFLSAVTDNEKAGKELNGIIKDSQGSEERNRWAKQILIDPKFHQNLSYKAKEHLNIWFDSLDDSPFKIEGFLAGSEFTPEQFIWFFSQIEKGGVLGSKQIFEKIQRIESINGTKNFLEILFDSFQKDRLRPYAIEIFKKVEWKGVETLLFSLNSMSSENEATSCLCALLIAKELNDSKSSLDEWLQREFSEEVIIRLEKFISSPEFYRKSDDRENLNFDNVLNSLKQSNNDIKWFQSISHLTLIADQSNPRLKSERITRISEIIKETFESGAKSRKSLVLTLLSVYPSLLEKEVHKSLENNLTDDLDIKQCLLTLGVIFIKPDCGFLLRLKETLSGNSHHPINIWLKTFKEKGKLNLTDSEENWSKTDDRDLYLARLIYLILGDWQIYVVRNLIKGLSSLEDYIRFNCKDYLYIVSSLLLSDGSTLAVQEIADHYLEENTGKSGYLGTVLVTALSCIKHKDSYWLEKWINPLDEISNDHKNNKSLLNAWLNISENAKEWIYKNISIERLPLKEREILVLSLIHSVCSSKDLKKDSVAFDSLICALKSGNETLQRLAVFGLQWMQTDEAKKIAEEILFEIFNIYNRKINEKEVTEMKLLETASDEVISLALLSASRVLNQNSNKRDLYPLFAALIKCKNYKIRQSSKYALTRLLQFEKNKIGILKSFILNDEEILESLLHSTYDYDSWGNAKDYHFATLEKIFSWISKKSDAKRRRLLEIVLRMLRDEQRKMLDESSENSYSLEDMYGGWSIRRILIALVSYVLEGSNVYFDIAPDTKNKQDLVNCLIAMAGDLKCWESRMFANASLGNMQLFNEKVAEKFFSACYDTDDVYLKTLESVKKFKNFTVGSLQKLLSELVNQSATTTYHATSLIESVGRFRSDEITQEIRYEISEKLEMALESPLSEKPIYKFNNGQNIFVGYSYNEIYQSLDGMVNGEDSFEKREPENHGSSAESADWIDIRGTQEIDNDLVEKIRNEIAKESMDDYETLIGTKWNLAQVQYVLNLNHESLLDYENTTGSARKWWDAFIAENTHKLDLVLKLSEELRIRNATITEFFLAYVYSNTENITANLFYLDFLRKKKEEEENIKLFGPESVYENDILRDFDNTLFANNINQPKTRISEKIELLEKESELNLAPDYILVWWTSLKSKYEGRDHIILALLQQLKLRKLKLKDLYFSFVYSDVRGILANLCYLDYLILKKREQNIKLSQMNLKERFKLSRSNRFVGEIIDIRKIIFDNNIKANSNNPSDNEDNEDENLIIDGFTPEILANNQKSFEVCENCNSFLLPNNLNCFSCSNQIIADDEFIDLFNQKIEDWCLGISEYLGEVNEELCFKVINEKLSNLFIESIKGKYPFDLIDLSAKISRAAKYLIDEQVIANKIVMILLSNKGLLTERLNIYEQFVLIQIFKQIEDSYGFPTNEKVSLAGIYYYFEQINLNKD